MGSRRILSRSLRGALFFPQTIYINFRTLPFKQALKLPIIIMSYSQIKGVHKGNIIINAQIHPFMIRVGAQKTSKRGVHPSGPTTIVISDNGIIEFLGNASIGRSSSICAKGGHIIIGDGFSCNVNCFIYCQKSIIFRSDVLLGWNISIRDNDGHPIYDQDLNIINRDQPIIIGDHVWVASGADILKGVTIADNVIVGTRCLVSRSIEESNVIIGGIPGKVIRRNVSWEHDF